MEHHCSGYYISQLAWPAGVRYRPVTVIIVQMQTFQRSTSRTWTLPPRTGANTVLYGYLRPELTAQVKLVWPLR